MILEIRTETMMPPCTAPEEGIPVIVGVDVVNATPAARTAKKNPPETANPSIVVIPPTAKSSTAIASIKNTNAKLARSPHKSRQFGCTYWAPLIEEVGGEG